MHADRFADLLRAFSAPSLRRRALIRLAATALGVSVTLPSSRTIAKKRKKEPQFNAFGCLDVGQPCGGKDQLCCSGSCKGKKPRRGKKDKRHCVGHDASTCLAGQDACAAELVSCESSHSPFARCVTTTGQAAYCAGDVFCRSCARDADCTKEEFESGAACIICSDCAENTACATLRTFA